MELPQRRARLAAMLADPLYAAAEDQALLTSALAQLPRRFTSSDGVESAVGASLGYVQGHVYRASDIRAAYEAGARDCRANGGNPSDHLIERASDAYLKSVHPMVKVPALVIYGVEPDHD